MCDYSLQNVKSRPAKVGDKLTTRYFGTGTIGFAALEDYSVAVCVLPGTELCFAGEVASLPAGLLRWRDRVIDHKTAIFRQISPSWCATSRAGGVGRSWRNGLSADVSKRYVSE
jgi:hypothetical protein